jgi:hypothetical protein
MRLVLELGFLVVERDAGHDLAGVFDRIKPGHDLDVGAPEPLPSAGPASVRR